MTTAAARLVALAGVGGTAGELLAAIGAGTTAALRLVAYSGIASNTAAVHLMTDVARQAPGGGIGHSGKKKPVWIERDGEYLIFASPAKAAAYIDYERNSKKPAKTGNSNKRAKESPPVKPIILDVQALKAHYNAKSEAYKLQQSIDEIVRLRDIDTLLMLQMNLIEWQKKQDAIRRENEELAILLLI